MATRAGLRTAGWAVALLVAACGDGPEAGAAGESRSAPAIAVVDDAGRAVRLARPARRIVSLVPSVTETVLALGGADRLVARTRYDLDPRLASLPSLGGGLDLSKVVLVGARDLDPAERALIDAGAPRLVTAGSDLAQRLGMAIADRAIYVHIDCDVMEPGLIPTEYSVPDGLTLDELSAACSVIARNDIVGLEIAEFEAASNRAADETSIGPLLNALQPLIAATMRT